MRGSGLSGFKKIEIERWDYAELGQSSSDFKNRLESRMNFRQKKNEVMIFAALLILLTWDNA